MQEINKRVTIPLIVLFFTLVKVAKSQTTQKEMIVANYQRQGLPFVNIILKNKNVGTYSNEQGHFSIFCEQNDTLLFSAIGFETKSVSCFEVKDTIFLNTQLNLLPELTIKGNKDKHKTQKLTIGNIKNKWQGSFTDVCEGLLFIPNEKKVNAKIISAIFRLDRLESDMKGKSIKSKEMLVRLTLYTRKTNSVFPDKSIAKTSLTQKVKPHQKVVRFDITEWDLRLPTEGIFVGIEFLGHYDKDIFIPFDKNKKNRDTRFLLPFSRVQDYSHSFIRSNYGKSLEKLGLAEYGSPSANFNFGIEVEVID
jgi:L-rhamnose mutarotase